ncbi:GNAT family N-acetyltransferase [Micromonospora tulbaghiae]|uniref:GNAT family N-acetyltransferase n=1 Tax=Micromonospora tulbaghiae TaxID=479978 RepID=UPI0033DB691F
MSRAKGGRSRTEELACHPLTEERWPDLLRLFGDRGAANGCWCMFWRLRRSEFESNRSPGNRRALRELVRSGVVPGVLGYRDDEPVGWCSVAPREEYGSLERSPKYRRTDETPVWSVVCFFLAREHRGEGLAAALLDGAVTYAGQQGATVVEGYPVCGDDGSHYMGTASLFERCGFTQVRRVDERRAVYRRQVG